MEREDIGRKPAFVIASAATQSSAGSGGPGLLRDARNDDEDADE
ncbi:MAG: hypothetical protein PGN12_09730 [Sphingomonas phyllosphaerae]